MPRRAETVGSVCIFAVAPVPCYSAVIPCGRLVPMLFKAPSRIGSTNRLRLNGLQQSQWWRAGDSNPVAAKGAPCRYAIVLHHPSPYCPSVRAVKRRLSSPALPSWWRRPEPPRQLTCLLTLPHICRSLSSCGPDVVTISKSGYSLYNMLLMVLRVS